MGKLSKVLMTHARGRLTHIIFCPGMGGHHHPDQFFRLWQSIGMWFSTWHTFASGGSDFMAYDDQDILLHPGGRPNIVAGSIGRLLALISSYDPADHVLLVGFSAGAYLILKTVQEMVGPFAEGHPSVSFFVMGHYLFPDDLMQAPVSLTHGVIILGEHEMLPRPYVEDYGSISLSDLPDYLSADSFAVSAWGGYCGDARKCMLMGNAFLNAHILMAVECSHSIRDYDWALRHEAVYYMAGRQLPSSMATSSRSSGFSSSSWPESVMGARVRSHSI
jgi:hypothetical protein